MRAWIIRTWYRLFHKDRVFTVVGLDTFKPKDIVVTPDKICWMCLGKGYFLLLKNQSYVGGVDPLN